MTCGFGFYEPEEAEDGDEVASHAQITSSGGIFQMLERRQSGKSIGLLVAAVGLMAGCGAAPITVPAPTATTTKPVPIKALAFSLARYPAVSDHIRDAIAAGESAVCTLDRKGAGDRRTAAVAGHATAKGKDRDEYPFAICAEGGKGASVRLVPSGENRSAGAWMANKLERWPDGTRFLVVVGK